MRKIFSILFLAVLILSACNTPFKKGKEGMEYKIIRAKGGKLIASGGFIALDIVAKYKDSTLSSTFDQGMPNLVPYDTSQFPPAYKEIFGNLHLGDSIIIRTSTDTIAKTGGMPPFMKKGEFVYQSFKISGSYANQGEADAARISLMEKSAKVQKEKDDVKINEYLKKNNITSTKAPKGTYVQIMDPGTGALLDTTMYLKVNYTGKTLAGKVFDSNTDPSKGHLEPLIVNLTNDMSMGSIIPGWKDGLSILKKGAKAKFVIPSSLAYGAQGSGMDIGPNEVLVFDIDVLDIVSKAEAKASIDAMQKKMEEMRKHYMDSVQKATPSSGAPPPGH